MSFGGSVATLISLGFRVVRKWNDMTILNKLEPSVPSQNITLVVVPRAEGFTDVYVDLFQLAVNHDPSFKVDDQLDRDMMDKMIKAIMHKS